MAVAPALAITLPARAGSAAAPAPAPAQSATTAPGVPSGDATRGLATYQQRCAACHAADFNGVGPAHRGVFGRAAASAQGYAYSTALRQSKLVWDAANLDRWLSNPEALVPGQKMGVSVSEPELRADLIAYLKTLTAH